MNLKTVVGIKKQFFINILYIFKLNLNFTTLKKSFYKCSVGKYSWMKYLQTPDKW